MPRGEQTQEEEKKEEDVQSIEYKVRNNTITATARSLVHLFLRLLLRLCGTLVPLPGLHGL